MPKLLISKTEIFTKPKTLSVSPVTLLSKVCLLSVCFLIKWGFIFFSTLADTMDKSASLSTNANICSVPTDTGYSLAPLLVLCTQPKSKISSPDPWANWGPGVPSFPVYSWVSAYHLLLEVHDNLSLDALPSHNYNRLGHDFIFVVLNL